MKKKTSLKRKLMIALCVVLALILVVLLTVTMVAFSILNKIPRVESTQPTLSDEEIDVIIAETDPTEPDATVQEVAPEEITMPTEPAAEIEQEDHIVNILLIGQDRRPGEIRARSDAMILCTVNTKEKTLVMTSFLRDLYVPFPDYNGRSYDANRLNATYVIGGMEMLDECLEMNFGVDIDHNVEVDFSGFEKVVDAMGGVDLYLTEGETWYVSGTIPGMNHLNGHQALAYARIRYLDSDFGRTNRQRNVLNALMQKAKGMSVEQLENMINTVFPLITTDMTNADILRYLFEFAPMLKDLEITTQHIPADGTYDAVYVKGMAVLVPDIEANREILKETLGE